MVASFDMTLTCFVNKNINLYPWRETRRRDVALLVGPTAGELTESFTGCLFDTSCPASRISQPVAFHRPLLSDSLDALIPTMEFSNNAAAGINMSDVTKLTA